jgi:hypothetical protein
LATQENAKQIVWKSALMASIQWCTTLSYRLHVKSRK